MLELQTVVYYKNEGRLMAVVDDRANGVRRSITCTWKDKTALPPRTWGKAVYGELEHQRGEAQRQLLGGLFR